MSQSQQPSIPGHISIPQGLSIDEIETSIEGERPETVDPKHEIPIDDNFTGPYFQAIGKRKIQERDAKTLVTADHAQTGVGKTSICDFLAYVCDTTEPGFSADKVAIDPPEFFGYYKDPPNGLPSGSSAILEEGEQLDARRFMSNENVDASHVWAKNRIREIIAFINLPSPEMIDSRLELLADYWVNVEIRGRARIYQKKVHRTKKKVYFETMQVLNWPNMDGSKTFRAMDRLKRQHINDDEKEENWIRKSELEKRLKKQKRELTRSVRDEIIRGLINNNGKSNLGPADIAHGFDISQQRIGQIARGE